MMCKVKLLFFLRYIFVSWECCVFLGRGLCVGLITRPEASYRVWSWIPIAGGQCQESGLRATRKENLINILLVHCLSQCMCVFGCVCVCVLELLWTWQWHIRGRNLSPLKTHKLCCLNIIVFCLLQVLYIILLYMEYLTNSWWKVSLFTRILLTSVGELGICSPFFFHLSRLLLWFFPRPQ